MHFRPLRLACPTLGTMHQMDKRFMHDRDEDCGNLLRRVPFFRPGQGSRSRRAGGCQDSRIDGNRTTSPGKRQLSTVSLPGGPR